MLLHQQTDSFDFNPCRYFLFPWRHDKKSQKGPSFGKASGSGLSLVSGNKRTKNVQTMDVMASTTYGSDRW